MATRQYLIPGIGFINETGTRADLLPGAGFVNETVAAGVTFDASRFFLLFSVIAALLLVT